MGSVFKGIYNTFAGLLSRKPEFKCLILGLDNAGKTTLLYMLKLGEVVNSVPTIGFNVETLSFKTASFHVWDIGRSLYLRRLWHHYYVNTQAIAFVVDCSDREWIHKARDELDELLKAQELKTAHLLVLANKIDREDHMSVQQIKEQLALEEFQNRTWNIRGCCGLTGEGLHEAFEWLALSYTHN